MSTQYFFAGEVDPIGEEISGRIFWFRPSAAVAERVMTDPGLMVKGSGGERLSGDDFWRAAGELMWDTSRVKRSRSDLVKQFGQAVPS